MARRGQCWNLPIPVRITGRPGLHIEQLRDLLDRESPASWGQWHRPPRPQTVDLWVNYRHLLYTCPMAGHLFGLVRHVTKVALAQRQLSQKCWKCQKKEPTAGPPPHLPRGRGSYPSPLNTGECQPATVWWCTPHRLWPSSVSGRSGSRSTVHHGELKHIELRFGRKKKKEKWDFN